MIISELPEESQDELRSILPATGFSWEQVRQLSVEEFRVWMQAKTEDFDRRIELNTKLIAIDREVAELLAPVMQTHPDLELGKAIWFLRGDARSRIEELMRERAALRVAVPVTRNRQPWHEAVENEVARQMAGNGTSVEQIAEAVLAGHPDWPRDAVEGYAFHLLESGDWISY